MAKVTVIFPSNSIRPPLLQNTIFFIHAVKWDRVYIFDFIFKTLWWVLVFLLAYDSSSLENLCLVLCGVSSGAGCKYRWKGYFFPLDEKPVRINRTVNKSVLWTDYSLIRDLWSSAYNLQPLNFQGVLVVSKCEAHCETCFWPPDCQ